jgi:hypothetical protein
MDDEPAKCENCHYWRHPRVALAWSEASVGKCRRHAPVTELTYELRQPQLHWPQTYCDDWCGEHLRRAN